jgi:hypothetical protein
MKHGNCRLEICDEKTEQYHLSLNFTSIFLGAPITTVSLQKSKTLRESVTQLFGKSPRIAWGLPIKSFTKISELKGEYEKPSAIQ